MKSISPIVGTILIIVITVTIAGLFYAFTSGMFNSIISSSNNLVNQQSKIISFTINTVYCSNNILYFDIYNKGNIPININNSEIIFTDNYGNTISINGNNIVCNNGNIINIGSNSLCYVLNYFCYYNYTDYIKSTNFIYNGINYNYEILDNNKFIIYYSNSNSTSNASACQPTYLPLILYNTQSIATPSPFQQDIAICNGSINIGNNFAYINNVTLFNEIDSNGQNVYFATTCNSTPNIYSWYEGQLINGSTYCDEWWINLQNGIPANSNITIYMYIGNSSSNYYSQYYPYVGAPIQVLGTSQYDNGQDIFNYYQNFGNLSALPSGWTYIYFNQNNVSFSTDYTIIPPLSSNYGNDGITTTNNYNLQNNAVDIYASVPNINTHTGYQWIVLGVGAANNTNTYFIGPSGGIVVGGNIYDSANNDGAAFSGEGTGVFSLVVGTSGSLGSVNYSYVPTMYSIGFSSSNTYFLVNYSQVLSTTIIPGSFSLPITIGQQEDGGNIYLYWVLLRSLPPNDIMPSIYIN